MQRVQRTPQVVVADRGFGSKDNEVLLRAVGIKQISLPYIRKARRPSVGT